MTLGQLAARYPLQQGVTTILISEVTQMSNAVCVAGWDLHEGRIVRPLMPTGANWPVAEYTAGRIVPGAFLHFRPMRPQPRSAYPHASEDFRAREFPTVSPPITESNLYAALEPTADASVAAIFGNAVVGGKYLLENTVARSLGAIVVPPRRVVPRDDGYGSLRVDVIDAEGIDYDLKVTQMSLRRATQATSAHAVAGQLTEKLRSLPDNAGIMLRIGLSRAWAGSQHNWDPKRCYMQLNGIVFSR